MGMVLQQVRNTAPWSLMGFDAGTPHGAEVYQPAKLEDRQIHGGILRQWDHFRIGMVMIENAQLWNGLQFGHAAQIKTGSGKSIQGVDVRLPDPLA